MRKSKDITKAYKIVMGRALERGISSISELADDTGFVRQTLSNKLRRPWTMTLSELAYIADYLQMDDSDILELIRLCKR